MVFLQFMQRPNDSDSSQFPPFLDTLNIPQKAAVIHIDGPVMIIAGAGSGKTRVLTYRMAYLLHKNVDAFEILALTFTNKAAKEMRNRIEKVTGAQARNLWMGTFHSVFARILRQESDRMGYPANFTIYDTEDSKNLLKSIIKEMNLDEKIYKPSMILSRISMAKNNLIEAKHYVEDGQLTKQDTAANRPKFSEIFAAYTGRCFKAGAMDFDDLLLNTFKLLVKHIDICNKWQHKFKYILVDEYQDTNHVQYMIVRKLAAVHQNICVVGDDAQSIYAFRGANIQNILNFERDYPDVKTYKLEQNYRSTQTIVKAASSLIKYNRAQLEKNIWSANAVGEKIKVLRNATEGEEARKVSAAIFDEKMLSKLPNKAFAILYRTNSQSRALEESLRKQGIDYRIYGGQSFYQRKEVKDLLTYLRLIVNPSDEEALKRIINYPGRGIGDTTVNRILVKASQDGVSLWNIICSAQNIPELGPSGGKVENFALMIQSFRTMLETHNAYDLAMHVAKQTGILKTLFDDKSIEGVSRYENITELLNGIQEFVEDDESEKEKKLAIFLEDVALFTDEQKNKDPDRDCISLMTIHASKGLEFPVIFVVGLEENLFPSQLSLNTCEELEEERRLFYVAITRAKIKLYITFATSRFRYGSLMPCEPSRFIKEIESQYLDIPVDSTQFPAQFRSLKTGPFAQDKNQNEKPTNMGKLFSAAKPIFPPAPQADPNFVQGDLRALKIGDRVQHQRFGDGVVSSIDGINANAKAVVNFDQLGQKTLVLKFAKMRIL